MLSVRVEVGVDEVEEGDRCSMKGGGVFEGMRERRRERESGGCVRAVVARLWMQMGC